MSESVNFPQQTEIAAVSGAAEGQVLELIDCFDTIVNAVLPQSMEPEEETTLQEVKALHLLGRNPSCTVSEFARALDVTLSTASHTLDRLARKRALKRTRSLQDRRVVFISLARKSLKRQKAFLEHRTEACRVLLNQLNAAERDLTISIIRRLAEASRSEVVSTFTAAGRSRSHAAKDRR